MNEIIRKIEAEQLKYMPRSKRVTAKESRFSKEQS